MLLEYVVECHSYNGQSQLDDIDCVVCKVLLLLFRWYQRNLRKGLDFDNPVYRHTTTSQFVVLQPKSLSSVCLPCEQLSLPCDLGDINPLIATLKPQSSGPSHSNTVIPCDWYTGR